jgi:hypothetical protein
MYVKIRMDPVLLTAFHDGLEESIMDFIFQTQWSPYVVGAGIGVLSWISFLISKKPLACSTTFARIGGLIERLLNRASGDKAYYKKIKVGWGWQEMLVTGIVFGALLSSLLSGDFGFDWVPGLWETSFGGGAVTRVAVTLIGGVFIGFGARWAGGCTSGHGISGTMQLAVSSWIASVFFFVGGILAAHLLFAFAG